MDSLRRTPDEPSPEAVEFVRFCYRRRRAGWPELYDEMCAVASRGVYRGWTHAELSERGIGFGLFELHSLAAIVGRVVEEETDRRRALGPMLARRSSGIGERSAESSETVADRPLVGVPVGVR